MKGFDNSLLDECRKYINVPVLVNGGLSCPKEISSLKKIIISMAFYWAQSFIMNFFLIKMYPQK